MGYVEFFKMVLQNYGFWAMIVLAVLLIFFWIVTESEFKFSIRYPRKD